MRAGKHYASFESFKYFRSGYENSVMMGVMRPGQANTKAIGYPFYNIFYDHFSQNTGHGECNNNNNVQCCMYYAANGASYFSDWAGSNENEISWEGMETMSFDDELGMLLDLDEGTLSVYKNGRKLGVIKSGLAGPYCWVVSMQVGAHVGIKRGTIPPN